MDDVERILLTIRFSSDWLFYFQNIEVCAVCKENFVVRWDCAILIIVKKQAWETIVVSNWENKKHVNRVIIKFYSTIKEFLLLSFGKFQVAFFIDWDWGLIFTLSPIFDIKILILIQGF